MSFSDALLDFRAKVRPQKTIHHAKRHDKCHWLNAETYRLQQSELHSAEELGALINKIGTLAPAQAARQCSCNH